jgi:cytidine deaminase
MSNIGIRRGSFTNMPQVKVQLPPPPHLHPLLHFLLPSCHPCITMIPQILRSSNESQVSSTCSTYGITTEQFSDLHTRCVKAKSTAYCPYSRFRVGATILTDEGVYIDGANVENASYPVGTCAERVAFGKAVTEGYKKFKAVAVATDITPPASPCGMCRQLLVLPNTCNFEIPYLWPDFSFPVLWSSE